MPATGCWCHAALHDQDGPQILVLPRFNDWVIPDRYFYVAGVIV
jgi:hypothetical protein